LFEPGAHQVLEKETKFIKSSGFSAPTPQDNGKEERLQRIVDASLEVFSEFSFEDATTGEIARRARVSKRDIYANFPNKHFLLIATMSKVLQTEDDNIVETIADTQGLPSLEQKLVVIGLKLINEVLSRAMSVITRLVTSETINQPLIGTVYFENGPARRGKLISEVLAMHMTSADVPAMDTIEPAEHYLALVTYQPRLTTLVGMQDAWNHDSIQMHVNNAVKCFLRAHPAFA
jgi:AcrR family transcriptional regulator